jgi:hypothetical protein
VSTLLLVHATVYVCLHNFLNVLVQIANKMGLQKKQCVDTFDITHLLCMLFGVSGDGLVRLL